MVLWLPKDSAPTAAAAGCTVLLTPAANTELVKETMVINIIIDFF